MPKVKSEEILKTSQNYYLMGDFDSAKNVILEGKSSLDQGLFHYNLGSIYLKMGSLGVSRYHLEKANAEGFTYPMLWKNLKYIKAQQQVYDPTKSNDFYEIVVGKTMDAPYLALCAIFLVSLVFALATIRKSMRLWTISTLFLLLGSLPISLRLVAENKYDFAIALKPIRIHEGPSKIYPDYGVLSEGSRIVVSEFHDDWYYITFPSNLSGWVEKGNLGFY